MDEKLKALISASQTVAIGEGITETEAQATRINELIKDAQLDEPATPAGKIVKERAADIIAVNKTAALEGVRSPYTENKFDYDANQDKTCLPSVSAILALIGQNAEFLAIPTKTPTKEYEDACGKAYDKVIMGVLDILAENNVGLADFTHVFKVLQTIIEAIKQQIDTEVVGHRHEIMSRILGTRNPGSDKFDSNHATWGDLKESVLKVRESTGGKLEDYFTIVKSDEEKTQ